MTSSSKGTIVEVLRNDEKLYDGDLAHYFRVLFFHAQNLRHPYHNLRHMLHVVWLCYQACIFYGPRLTVREVRNLLIAAIMHDFDHSGLLGNDDLNIERAIRGFRKHVAPEDREHLADIEAIIRPTEYPYKEAASDLSLLAQVLRDADASQGLSIAWIQQVVIGLATEWDKKPLDVLRMQDGFLGGLKLHTEWAQHQFPKEVIQAKIDEANALVDLLESPTV
jgi:hypothetical protein